MYWKKDKKKGKNEISEMLSILAKWLGKKKRAVKPRLEEKDVLSIAREAASDYPNCENLGIVILENRSGDLVWIVSSATIGQTLHVSIDDQSSEILEIKQVGFASIAFSNYK